MTTDTKKVVRKPIKKKRKPPKNTVATVKITTGREREIGQNAWLRRLAGLKYITSQKPMSLKQLYEDPEFRYKVTYQSLQNWCQEDRWIEQRKQYYDNITEAIKQQISSRQIKSRVEQLKALDEIATRMHEKIVTDAADPGTYEGMVGAYLKAEILRENIRDKILKEVIPDSLLGGLGSEDGKIVPQLTEEEAREAALAIIKKRRGDKEQTTEKDKTGNGKTVE